MMDHGKIQGYNKQVVLPTRPLILKFYEAVRTLPNHDYEVPVILEEIIGACQQDSADYSLLVDLSEHYLKRFCEMSEAEAGERIARAVFDLGIAIKDLLLRTGLYDKDGILWADFLRLVGDDLVVMVSDLSDEYIEHRLRQNTSTAR